MKVADLKGTTWEIGPAGEVDGEKYPISFKNDMGHIWDADGRKTGSWVGSDTLDDFLKAHVQVLPKFNERIRACLAKRPKCMCISDFPVGARVVATERSPWWEEGAKGVVRGSGCWEEDGRGHIWQGGHRKFKEIK